MPKVQEEAFKENPERKNKSTWSEQWGTVAVPPNTEYNWVGWSDRDKCKNMNDYEMCTCGGGKKPWQEDDVMSCRNWQGKDVNQVSCENGSTPVPWKNEWGARGFACKPAL